MPYLSPEIWGSSLGYTLSSSSELLKKYTCLGPTSRFSFHCLNRNFFFSPSCLSDVDLQPAGAGNDQTDISPPLGNLSSFSTLRPSLIQVPVLCALVTSCTYHGSVIFLLCSIHFNSYCPRSFFFYSSPRFEASNIIFWCWTGFSIWWCCLYVTGSAYDSENA